MPAGAVPLDFDEFLDASAPVEADLRRQYMRLGGGGPLVGTTKQAAQQRVRSETFQVVTGTGAGEAYVSASWAEELIQRSARYLEMLLVVGCTYEVLDERGSVATEEEGWPDVVRSRVQEISGLDPIKVTREARQYLLPSGPLPKTTPPVALRAVVRSVRAIIESCPIDDLEALAAHIGCEAWGHRCRVAYTGLRAFVQRNDPGQRNRLKVIGRVYMTGEMDIDEVALLLGVDSPDAAALLEQHGYARPLGVITLSEEERERRYNAIREDRLNRRGATEPFAERSSRDVVASERIEGVDARRWVPRGDR